MRSGFTIGLSVVIVCIGGLLMMVVGSGSGAHTVQMVTPPEHALGDLTPVALLREPIPDTNPDAVRLRRGQYLVAAGDCMSCHLRAGGEPFAGGLGLTTPFGTIYSSNITSDSQTGIGGWSEEQFYRAMHAGIGAQGENLYPAFPYPWFRNLPREDTDAILAYLKTTPPVRYTPPDNELHFPMGFRFLVKGWNLLHLKEAEFQADSTRSPEWNRGAWLVKGPGHCSGCHTAKGSLGADKSERAFFGGDLDSWVAPDLTPNTRTGLGAWGAQDIADYLKSGRNAHAAAGGPMADVVTYSTSFLTDADRKAISTYLQSLPASPAQTPASPQSGAMQRGAAIYSYACTACHLEGGIGQPGYFPPLKNDAMVQQSDPTGLVHLILAGSRIGTSASSPSPLTMPSFAWKLSDPEVADVVTYIRNSWGNAAGPVAAEQVRQLRKRLGLDTLRPTANSGDWQ
jgi:mono/diheme cytochrome c family protein